MRGSSGVVLGAQVEDVDRRHGWYLRCLRSKVLCTGGRLSTVVVGSVGERLRTREGVRYSLFPRRT